MFTHFRAAAFDSSILTVDSLLTLTKYEWIISLQWNDAKAQVFSTVCLVESFTFIGHYSVLFAESSFCYLSIPFSMRTSHRKHWRSFAANYDSQWQITFLCSNIYTNCWLHCLKSSIVFNKILQMDFAGTFQLCDLYRSYFLLPTPWNDGKFISSAHLFIYLVI